uniref:Uncharacterized protein n=1 Tax=Trichobilharzia regenti TaxID=157069 RepID=A0AA85JMC8_TRIRE|nr:unnamed protein product [Trichobilharzia regenti]
MCIYQLPVPVKPVTQTVQLGVFLFSDFRTSPCVVKQRTSEIHSHSAILSHLVNTGHKIDVNEATFKVIYRIPTNLNFALRVHLLHIAEAVGIHINKPNLCIRKKLVQKLSLPWPSRFQ